MRIGILGSGFMGGKLGTIFARAGHEVVFSYARNADKRKRLAKGAGHNARAGTPAEAAQDVPTRFCWRSIGCAWTTCSNRRASSPGK
ncbi:MAG TPA: NAD(P)-binding domain-containing protein [Burkholderiales bacterium]|nr:NAD(P)-binding domain-containing protein [Burkholderiales bacterium]